MRRTRFITLVLAHVLGACSALRPATPEEVDDTAQAIGTMIAAGGGGGDVASISDSLQIALGAIPVGFGRAPDGLVHGRRLDLDFGFMVTCKDAAGMTLARCDKTTDEATVGISWSGSVDTPSFDAMTNGTGSWTLAGLQSDTTTFSGASTFSSSAELTPLLHPGVTRTYEFDALAEYNVTLVDTPDLQSIDGTAIFDVSGRRTLTGTRHDFDDRFRTRTVVTFHADNTASLVADGTRHYLMDLATGEVVRVD